MYHGIKSNVLTDGARAIRVATTAVIDMIGTAPDADAPPFPSTVRPH